MKADGIPRHSDRCKKTPHSGKGQIKAIEKGKKNTHAKRRNKTRRFFLLISMANQIGIGSHSSTHLYGNPGDPNRGGKVSQQSGTTPMIVIWVTLPIILRLEN